MQPRQADAAAAAAARAARLLGLLGLLAIVAALAPNANAAQYNASSDLNHLVIKRSPNEGDNDKYKSGPDNDDFLGEQVSATEDSISASEDEKTNEFIKSGGASSGAIRDLDDAPSVAPNAADSGRRSTITNDEPTTPLPITEPTLSRRSASPDDPPITESKLTPDKNTNELDSNLLMGVPANTVVAQSNTNSSQQESDQSRRTDSDDIFETVYNPTIGENWGNLNNPHALQPKVKLKDQISRFLGNQPALHQRPGFLNPNQNSYPYNPQSVNADPRWNVQTPVVGTSYTGAGGLDPQAPSQMQLNPYMNIANAEATAAETFRNPSSPRTLIPRNELLYLESIPGADNLVRCGHEGEMYSLRTPWSDECLICACVVERGRVQPACARCASCTSSVTTAPELPTPFDNEKEPLYSLQLPTHVPQPEVGNAVSGPAAACAPLPFAQPFEQPLNPCRICICQKRNHLSNEVYVSCTEDPQCVKQPPLEPILPNTAVTTALCGKFPAHVQFPHPTQKCQVCTCVQRHPTTFALNSDMHLQCTKDYNCKHDFSITTPRSYFPGQNTNNPFELYINPNNPDFNPFRPPNVTGPSDFGFDIDMDATALADDENELTPPKPGSYHIPQYPEISKGSTPASLIPKLPQRPGYLPFEVNPGAYPSPQQPTGLQPFQQQAIPWPPKTVPALPKREQGPLLGPPPHRSCAPYPVNTPFEHPWDSCQLCKCAEYPAPGQHSVEVNCYTKPSCCVEPPVYLPSSSTMLPGSDMVALPSSSTLLPPESDSSAQLQILDAMCELKSLGAEFVNERDSCQVCSCVPLGRAVAPLCRSNGDPHCKPDHKPTSPSLINYVESKCRHHSPDQPFVSGCSVCVCHIVFTLVVVKCTPQPNCLEQEEKNSKIINPTNTGSLNTPKNNQPYTNPIFGNQLQNLPLSTYNTAYMNALQQLQRHKLIQNAQKTSIQTLGYRPELQLSEAQKYGGYPGFATGANSLASLDQWKRLQAQATAQVYELGNARPYSGRLSGFDQRVRQLIQGGMLANKNIYPTQKTYLPYMSSQDLNMNRYRSGFDQQLRGQPSTQNQEVESKARADITANGNINAKQKTNMQADTPSLDAASSWNQLNTVAPAGADNDILTYSPLSYSYSPPQMTYYPLARTDANTPLYESRNAQSNVQADSSGLLSALSNAGASGELVTRSGSPRLK